MDRRTGAPLLDWRSLTLAFLLTLLPLSAQESPPEEIPPPPGDDSEALESIPGEPPDSGEILPESLPETVTPPPETDSAPPRVPQLHATPRWMETKLGELAEDQEEIRETVNRLASPRDAVPLFEDSEAFRQLRRDIEALELAIGNLPPPPAEAETSAEPANNKIFILTILTLVLVAVGIFLQLFANRRGMPRRPAAPSHREDFKTLHDRLDNQKTQLDTIATNLEPLREPPPHPLTREELEAALPQALAPLQSRLDAFERPTESSLDLEPLQNRLQAQEDALAAIQSNLAELVGTREADAEEARRSASLQSEVARLEEELERRQSEWSSKADQTEREVTALRASLDEVRQILPAWLQGENLPDSFSADLQTFAIASRNPRALEFLGAALALEGLLQQPDPSRKVAAQALSQLSHTAYRYLLEELRAEKDVVRKTMRSWIANLTEVLTSRSISLRISQVFPGDGFHLDTMEAVDSVSGNRLNVDQPLSWLIEDTSQSPSRVLIRAKVITA